MKVQPQRVMWGFAEVSMYGKFRTWAGVECTVAQYILLSLFTIINSSKNEFWKTFMPSLLFFNGFLYCCCFCTINRDLWGKYFTGLWKKKETQCGAAHVGPLNALNSFCFKKPAAVPLKNSDLWPPTLNLNLWPLTSKETQEWKNRV